MKQPSSHLILDTLEKMQNLKANIPEAIDSFTQLSQAALKPGKLDNHIKELIVLAIAMTIKSPRCVEFHLKSLINDGLTEEELAEVIAICIYMGGGPAATIGLDAYELFHSFKNDKPATCTEDKNTSNI